MNTHVIPFTTIDVKLTRWMAHHSVLCLRLSLGVVFLWFGTLKFFPGVSPAEDLAGRTITLMTFGLVPATVSLPVLALWEVVIGLGFLGRARLRLFAVLRQISQPAYYYYGLGDQVQLSTEIVPVRLR